MIDTLSIAANIKAPKEVWNKQPEPFLWNGLTFVPRYNYYGSISKYTGKLQNLYLALSLSGLFVSNSWHKFYTHGNNFTDYTFSEVAETFYLLNDQLQGSLNDTSVKKIAYGVVIEAKPDFNSWFMLRTKQPLPMSDNGNIYGAKIQLNDYAVKAYNKAYEVKQHNGLTIPRAYRIEKEVKHMKHLHRRANPIRINQASDLTNPEILRQLGNDFVKTYQQIEKIKTMDLQGLSIHELNVIASMRDKHIRAHLRQENNRTYKKYHIEYKSMVNERNSGNEIEQKIIEKVEFITAT